MNFKQITKALKELSGISSGNEKLAWLKNHDDEDLKTIFKWYFDTSKITGIAEKKFEKSISNMLLEDFGTCNITTFDDVIRYFDFHKTGTDADIKNVQCFMRQICSTSEEKETFKKLVCKNYPMGVDYRTINKVFPNLIPCYEVMLADKYLDLNENKRNKLFRKGRDFCIQEKLDGFRCTAWKENGIVKLISRQGKLITGLVDIENVIKELPFDNFVLDGELLLTDRENVPSKMQYKATSKIVSTKDEEKHGITLNVFDMISVKEWNSKNCLYDYETRYGNLMDLVEKINSYSLQRVPNIVVTDDIFKIDSCLKHAQKKNWEGVMVRFMDSKYEWKRSDNLLKVKPMQEMDVIIKDYEEGSNSYTGMLGAFICEINHPKFGNIKTKVGGGYSEDERKLFWKNRKKMIGRVISIQYFEVTENSGTNQLSVRFPEFLELKEEGQEPNN